MNNSTKLLLLALVGAMFFLADPSGMAKKEVWNIPDPVSETFIEIPPAIARQPVQAKPAHEVAYLSETYTAQVLADFTVDGMVLSKRRYRSDATSDISPVDFALAWGDLATHPKVAEIKIRQGGRFYSYWYGPGEPIQSGKLIGLNSANMHMIPANDEVRRRLMKVKKSDLVHVDGHLVRVTADHIRPWKSSLTRTDSGNGACEIVLVTDIQIYRP